MKAVGGRRHAGGVTWERLQAGGIQQAVMREIYKEAVLTQKIRAEKGALNVSVEHAGMESPACEGKTHT